MTHTFKIRIETGFTVESGRYVMLLFYDELGHLRRVIGSYSSSDGGGRFMIERCGDDLYETFDPELDDKPSRHRDPGELLPWVIADGSPDE